MKDLLTETTILPELSFEDLLDIAPAKNNDSNSDTTDLDHDEAKSEEDTLNTPGPKSKIKITASKTIKPKDVQVKFSGSSDNTSSGDEQFMDNDLKVLPVIKELPNISETTLKPQFLLTNKNIGSPAETSTPVTIKPLIKIAPKIVTTTAKTTAVAPATKIEVNKSSFNTIGKTVVKTANGQIFYIPKSVAGTLPVVRLQTKSSAAITSVASTVTTASTTVQPTTTVAGFGLKPIITTTTTSATTNPITNKTLTIQVVRSADGKLMPLKAIATTTVASSATTAAQSITNSKITATTTNTTTSSNNPPTTTTTAAALKIVAAKKISIGSQLVGNKNILSTPSGQLIIKAPTKSVAATTATTSTSASAVLGKATPIVTGHIKPITTTLVTEKTSTETDTTTTSASAALKTLQIKRLGSTEIITTTTTTSGTTGTNSLIKPVSNVAVQIKPIAIGSKCPTETTAVKTFKIHRLTGTQILTTTTTTTNVSTAVTSLIKPTTFVKLPVSTTATTNPVSNKIVVQSVNGKQIVVSNQHIVKLVTKPTTATAASTSPTITTSAIPAKSTSIGKLQAIKIPGQPGVQYVRLLSAPKLAAAKATPAINKSITVTSSIPTTTASAVKTLVVCRALTTTTNTTTTISSAASSSSASITNVKFLNTLTQKVTFVRPLTNSKIVLAKPNKEETASLSTMHAKVQKAVVAVPSSGTSLLNRTKTTSTTTQPTTTTATATNSTMLGQKHKFADINSDNKVLSNDYSRELLDEDETHPKKFAPDNRIVVTSRNAAQQQKSVSIAGDKPEILNSKLPLKLKIASGKIGGGFKAPQQLFDSTLSKVKVKAPFEENKIRKVLPKPVKGKLGKPKQENLDIKEIVPIIDASSSTVLVRRKHCNCSKSQCLKLYCDCFANGEFCQDCTCRDCFNNLTHEDERQRAIQISLERNPNAFKPKITTAEQGDTSMRHNKGCNCKRSGCLKNYCECYEAKIMCSANCKCVACQNCEDPNFMDYDPVDPKILATLQANADKTTNAASVNSAQARKRADAAHLRNDDSTSPVKREREDLGNSDLDAKNLNISGEKQSVNFITDEVIAATVQCVISQADQCERVGLSYHQIEKLVLEEMGRCLVEIIDFSIRNTDQSFTQD